MALDYDKSFKMLVGTATYNDLGEQVIDGIEFNNEKGSIMVKSVEGLETPPIRNNNGNWSGRDGGFMSSQLYSGRIITVSGFYWDKEANCNIEYEERSSPYSLREQLTNYLLIRKKYPIFVKFISGRILYTEGFMTDFKMPYDAYNWGEYQITFFCPNYELSEAEIYGDPDSIWKRSVLYAEIPGGHLVPEDLPVMFRMGQHATKLDYTGLIPSWPIISMQGPATNPTFINIERNKYFRLGNPNQPDSDFYLAGGQTLVINMATRQVLVNGKSNSMYIDPDSSWWYLGPGQNTIYMLTKGDNENTQAEIKWTNNYQGT